MHPIQNKVLQRIMAYCAIKGITQAELGRRLGFHPASFNRIVNKGENLSIQRLSRIAAELNVPLLNLVTDGPASELKSLPTPEVQGLSEPIKIALLNIAAKFSHDLDDFKLNYLDLHGFATQQNSQCLSKTESPGLDQHCQNPEPVSA